MNIPFTCVVSRQGQSKQTILTNKHGNSYSDALICFDTKFKSLVCQKLIQSDIDFVKLSRYRHNEMLVEWSKVQYFYAPGVIQLRVRILLSIYIFFYNFYHFHKTKRVSMILLRILTSFIPIRYQRSVITYAH